MKQGPVVFHEVLSFSLFFSVVIVFFFRPEGSERILVLITFRGFDVQVWSFLTSLTATEVLKNDPNLFKSLFTNFSQYKLLHFAYLYQSTSVIRKFQIQGREASLFASF